MPKIWHSVIFVSFNFSYFKIKFECFHVFYANLLSDGNSQHTSSYVKNGYHDEESDEEEEDEVVHHVNQLNIR